MSQDKTISLDSLIKGGITKPSTNSFPGQPLPDQPVPDRKVPDEEIAREVRRITLLEYSHEKIPCYGITTLSIDRLFHDMVLMIILFCMRTGKDMDDHPDVYQWSLRTLFPILTKPEWKEFTSEFFEEKTELGDEIYETIQQQIVDPLFDSFSMRYFAWLCAWRYFTVKTKEKKEKELQP